MFKTNIFLYLESLKYGPSSQKCVLPVVTSLCKVWPKSVFFVFTIDLSWTYMYVQYNFDITTTLEANRHPICNLHKCDVETLSKRHTYLKRAAATWSANSEGVLLCYWIDETSSWERLKSQLRDDESRKFWVSMREEWATGWCEELTSGLRMQ